MFKTIKEALEIYKNMVREYIVKTNELKKVYGEADLLGWGRDDFNYVTQWTQTFKAIEKVLGLSEDEAKKIEDEVAEEIEKK